MSLDWTLTVQIMQNNCCEQLPGEKIEKTDFNLNTCVEKRFTFEDFGF